jgi:ABC-2 type transport system permease protein
MSIQTMGIPRRNSALGPARKTGFGNAVAFEWIKIRSVRSTLWTLVAAAAMVIAFAMLAGSQAKSGSSLPTVLGDIQGGIYFGQVAICVFGVLVATAEYGTGTISSSFSAVPSRPRLLAAKALVVWAVSTAVGLVISLVSFLLGTAMLQSGLPHPSLSDGSVLRSVIGMGLFLGVLGVFALAIGLLLRASAGAITAAIGVTLVAPIAFLMLGHVGTRLNEFWPTEAGRQILTIDHPHDVLSPGVGFGYFVVVTAVLFGAAVLRVNRRDA